MPKSCVRKQRKPPAIRAQKATWSFYPIYNTEAGKRALLSTLLRHLAKRHLRLAIRLRRHHRVNVWELFRRPGYRSRLALQYAVGRPKSSSNPITI
jgi:hypothetical protein